jgi:hypothetical protein
MGRLTTVFLAGAFAVMQEHTSIDKIKNSATVRMSARREMCGLEAQSVRDSKIN